MKYILPLLLIFLLACEQKQSHSEDVLDKGTMINLISELHVGEALVLNRNLPQDSSMMHYNWYQDSIMKVYGTDTATFHRSFAYWLKDLAVMNEMYGSVIDSLSLRRAELSNQIMQDSAAKDSVVINN